MSLLSAVTKRLVDLALASDGTPWIATDGDTVFHITAVGRIARYRTPIEGGPSSTTLGAESGAHHPHGAPGVHALARLSHVRESLRRAARADACISQNLSPNGDLAKLGLAPAAADVPQRVCG